MQYSLPCHCKLFNPYFSFGQCPPNAAPYMYSTGYMIVSDFLKRISLPPVMPDCLTECWHKFRPLQVVRPGNYEKMLKCLKCTLFKVNDDGIYGHKMDLVTYVCIVGWSDIVLFAIIENGQCQYAADHLYFYGPNFK